MRRLTLFVVCVAMLSPGVPGAWAQKTLSAKDLVRQAEEDQKNNRWQESWEKLKKAAEQKPKDKKIAESLQQASNYLADQAAARAITLCDQLEIRQCEQEMKRAASFANTQRVKEAQAKLSARQKEMQERWNAVQNLIFENRLAEATTELENLTRFSYLFPNLAAEKERLRRLRVEVSLEQGRKNMAAGKWDEAMEAFSFALRLEPGHSDAQRGVESVKREKEAATAFLQAQNAFQSKGFEVAYEANQRALRLFPDRQPYQDLARQIAEDWSKVLVEEAHKLSANPDNLKDNQKALENLEMVRRLDPRAQGLGEDLRGVRLALQSLYIQRAGHYESIADNSRIAITYAYYLNAQQSNPGGEFPFGAKLREVNNVFVRKRTVQLLLDVQNLSPAPPTFADVLLRRVRADIEKLGLPELKLRTLEEYAKNPMEDPQFVENHPDGKSPTALFKVELVNYEGETQGGDKPTEKPSKFVAGQEMMPNPAYEKMQAEYRKMGQALAGVKPGKRSKEGYTPQDLAILQQQLSSTPQQIAKDKVVDYTYQEFHLSVRALIKMNLELRDMLEKQLLGSDAIESSAQQTQVEIQGVREKDVNFLNNKTARLPQVDQLIKECERNGLQQIDEKAQKLVSQYLQRFYAEGQKAQREGRLEDALENFLCHWFFSRGRLPEAEARQIRELVKREIGLELSSS